MFEDKLLCSRCGGQCCKAMPGSAWPVDFGLRGRGRKDTSRLVAALKSGRWAIDWYEGDPRQERLAANLQAIARMEKAYFVRPATKGKEGWLSGRLYDPSWGGECTFLTGTGCSLRPGKRPRECRMLVPSANFPSGCKLKGIKSGEGKRTCSIKWLPWQEFLGSLKEDKQGGLLWPFEGPASGGWNQGGQRCK